MRRFALFCALSSSLACHTSAASSHTDTPQPTPADEPTAQQPAPTPPAVEPPPEQEPEQESAAPQALPTDRYGRVLKRYASARGFDYRALKGDTERTQDLKAYVSALATMPESAPLADWLNAYNALVVSSVIERWPVKSVMKVDGFFKKIPHQVAGKARTLDDIEHKVVRARFKDARVHFALNCGARSCPALYGEPFTSADVDETLDELTRTALAQPLHLRRKGKGLQATALLFWFKEDFVRDAGSVIGFLRKHAPRQTMQGLSDDAKISERNYDWALNQS